MGEPWGLDPRGNKIFVPGELIEALKKAALQNKREEKRQFFSDRTTVVPSKDGEPMFGDVLSYSAVYQPWNLVGGYRKPTDSPPFPFLREVARKSVIDRLIIDTRVAQIKHFARPVIVPGRQVGFRVVHERHGDPDFHEDESIKQRCLEVQKRLSNVTPAVHNSVRDFFSIAVNDELEIDRKCMVVFRDSKGRPDQHHLVDGASVKPRLQILLPWMFNNKTDNVDIAAEIMSYDNTKNPKKIDLTKAAYVQEVEGRFTAAWSAEQMSIDWTNPTSQINYFGYGRSLLEKSLESTRALVLAWNFNIEMFRTNYPEAILALLGDYDPQGLEAFKRQILGDVGQGGNWRLPVVPGGADFKVEAVKLRDTPQEMLFGEMIRMLVAIKAGAYRMHPSEINFSSDMGAQNTIFGREDTEKEVANATEEGLHTVMDGLADWLTRSFVKQVYDDLELIWDGIDRPNETQFITDLAAASQSFMLVDEARAKFNLKKLPAKAGAFINSPVYMEYLQLMMQQEQMEEQADQYDQGDFGQPDEETDGEQQESGVKPGQEWMDQTGPGSTEVPSPAMTQTGKGRKPGQMAPEGVPASAPVMKPGAKGKPGGKPFGKSASEKRLLISFLDDEGDPE